MKKWNYEINIKQHLISDGDFADFAKASNNIAKEFKKLPESLFNEEYSIQEDLEYLEGCAESDSECYDYLQDYVDEINYRINNLYDFADYHRIWCGL